MTSINFNAIVCMVIYKLSSVAGPFCAMLGFTLLCFFKIMAQAVNSFVDKDPDIDSIDENQERLLIETSLIVYLILTIVMLGLSAKHSFFFVLPVFVVSQISSLVLQRYTGETDERKESESAENGSEVKE